MSTFEVQILAMKPGFWIVGLLLFCAGCSKDKYTSSPQITFKSFSSNVWFNTVSQFSPSLKIEVTDAEGDLGYSNEPTYIYVKNITVPPMKEDSFKLPDLSSLVRTNLKVEVSAEISSVLTSSNQPTRPYTDTLFFEVYVKDKAGNKSNVITTPEPFYLITE